jgi:hypothetical protein
MIYNTQTVLQKAQRVQIPQPVMSVLENQIWFNKYAAMLLNAPCKVSFSDENGFTLIHDNELGFNLMPSSKGFAINSRTMIRKIQHMFNIERPKFLIKSTIVPTIFELKLIIK